MEDSENKEIYTVYCVGCRSKREIKDVEIETMEFKTRKGILVRKAHIKGKCVECGRTATKIGKNSDLLSIYEKNKQ